MTYAKFQHGHMDRKCLSTSKKYHILQMGTGNLKYYYEMSSEKLETVLVQCVKDLGVTIASNLNSPSNVKMLRVKIIMLGFINNFFF